MSENLERGISRFAKYLESRGFVLVAKSSSEKRVDRVFAHPKGVVVTVDESLWFGLQGLINDVSISANLRGSSDQLSAFGMNNRYEFGNGFLFRPRGEAKIQEFALHGSFKGLVYYPRPHLVDELIQEALSLAHTEQPVEIWNSVAQTFEMIDVSAAHAIVE